MSLLMICSFQAKGVISMTVREVGGDVVVEGAGSANLNGLNAFPSHALGGVQIGGEITNPVIPGGTVTDDYGYIYAGAGGNANTFLYELDPRISGPFTLGSPGSYNASNGSGDSVGLIFSKGDEIGLILPGGYVSGDSISGSGTYNSTTIESLGLIPGTYTWTWGTSPHNDSLVLTIESPVHTPPNPIPTLSEMAQILMMFLMIAMAGFYGRIMRKR